MAKRTTAEIEFKVINDGLKKDMQAINQEMSKHRQEQKLTQEQMKQTGSETDKLDSKLASLKSQYDTQTKAVETVSQQLANAQKYFGENSTEAAKYEKQLKSAQIYQQQLSNRIKETSDALSAAKGDTSTYAGAMNSIEQAQKKLAAEQAASTAEFKKWQATAGQSATEAEKLGKAQDYAGQQSKIAAAQVDLLKQALDQTEKEFGETSTEATQMKTKLAQAETAVAELGNEAKQVDTTNLNDIGKKIDTGNLMEAADTIGELGEKVKEIGSEAVNMSNEFGNATTRLNNSMGLTGQEAENMNQHVKNLYEKGLGDSFDSISEAVQQVHQQLGSMVSDADLESVTESAMNLSDTFDMDMGESLRGVNALMTAYGMTAQEAMDYIATGAQNGLNKTDELGDNLAEYAPLFEQNGYSADQMFSVLQAGLDSGAYNLDKVNDLVKEFGIRVADGSVQSAVEDLGDDWADMYKKMKDGGASNQEIFTALAKKVQGLGSDQEKATAISAIWGSQGEDNGTKVIEAMAGVSDSYTKVGGKMDDINKKSAANNEWEASLRKVKDALMPIGDTIKETFQPMLEMIVKLANKFETLPGPIKKIIVVVGAIAVAFMALMPIVAAVGAGLGIAFSVPGLIIIGVIAAIAGVVIAIKNIGVIVDWLKGLWQPMGEFFSGLWDGIKQGASAIWDSVKETWQSAVDGLKNIWSSIADFFSGLWQSIVNTASTIWNTLIAVFQVIFMTIQSVIQGVWLFITSWLQFAWNTIVQLTEPIWRPIADFFTNLWNGISNVAQNVWTTLSGWLSAAWGAISGVVSTIFSAIGNVISGVWNAISSATQAVWSVISSAVSTAASAVGNVVSTVWNGIKNVTSTVWNAIKSVISGVWDGIKNVASSAVNGISNTISGAWNGIKNTTTNVWNGIKSAMTGPIDAAANVISGIVNRIKGFFSGIQLSLPKINMPPMPHFKLNGSFSLKPPSVPHLSVDWYAKGGVMTRPTMFGMNGASPMVGGEAGSEAILPLSNRVLGTIGNSIAAATDNKRINNTQVSNTINLYNTISNDMDLDHVTNTIVEKITHLQQSKNDAFA